MTGLNVYNIAAYLSTLSAVCRKRKMICALFRGEVLFLKRLAFTKVRPVGLAGKSAADAIFPSPRKELDSKTACICFASTPSHPRRFGQLLRHTKRMCCFLIICLWRGAFITTGVVGADGRIDPTALKRLPLLIFGVITAGNVHLCDFNEYESYLGAHFLPLQRIGHFFRRDVRVRGNGENTPNSYIFLQL